MVKSFLKQVDRKFPFCAIEVNLTVWSNKLALFSKNKL